MQNQTTILNGKRLFLILLIVIGLSLGFSGLRPPLLAADDSKITSISVNGIPNYSPNGAQITNGTRKNMDFSFGAGLSITGTGTYQITMSVLDNQSNPITSITNAVQNNSSISFATLNLNQSTNYSITYTLTAINDQKQSQVVNEVKFSLYTGILDQTAPQAVTSFSSPVPVSGNIVLKFSEQLDPNSISNHVILSNANNSTIACSVTPEEDKTVLTIAPQNSLEYNTKYTISLIGLTDLAGNSMSGSLAFTTERDLVAPLTIVSSNPVPNAQNVSVSGPFTLSFNRELDKDTVNSSTVYLTNASGVPVEVSVVCTKVNEAGIITITPTRTLLYSTTYSINIVSNAVKDNSGRVMGSNRIVFTTQSNPQPPSIINQYPALAATSVGTASTVSFQFNQDMNDATISNTSVYLLKNGTGYVPAAVSYNPANRLVTITPSARLEGGVIYYVAISPTVKSVNGLSVTAPNWYFTITAALSSSTIIEYDPIANATSIPVDKVIKFRFNLPMYSASINNSSIYLSRAGTIIPATVSYDPSYYRVSITPSSSLNYYTEYLVNVSNAVKDSSLNSVTASSWKFTTGNSYSTGISERDPYANATGVAVDKVITFRFDNYMVASTINSSNIYLTRGGSTVYSQVTYDASTRRVSITPNSNLLPNTEYTVNLSNSIRDDYSGSYISAASWNFTTSSAYSSGVSERDPYSNASGVAVDKVITFRFDNNMNSSSINSSNIYLTRGGSTVYSRVAYDSSTRRVTITPDSNLLPNTEYTVNLNSSIRDYNGNYITAASWKFTTSSYSVGISERDPYANATGISLDKVIKFRFDNNMNSSTINSSNIYLTKGGATVYARVSYDSSTRWVTITPDNNLLAGTEYTVNLNSSIRDYNGNYVSSSSWKFTTKSTPVNILKIVAQEPSQFAADVSLNPIIKITFSADLDPASITSSNFSIISNDGTTIPANLNYDLSLYRVSLTPTQTLAPNTNYTVFIGNGVRDSSGNTMTAYSWSFRTAAVNTQAGKPGKPVVTFNGKPVIFNDVAPYIKNGRTLLPYRALLDLLGAETVWNQKQQKVTASLQGNTIELTIGSKKAYRNGKAITLEVAPEIKNSRTMIPLRFAAESLGIKTDWQASTYTIIFSR